MKFILQKSVAYAALVIVGVFTLLALTQIPNLRFDYDFEKFFPDDDPDLVYYRNHIENFESDNDFLLIGIPSKGSVFQQDFLTRLDSVTDSLSSLKYVRQVAGPTTLGNPIIGPFGVIQARYIHINKPENYPKDSLRIAETPGLVGSFFSEDFTAASLFLKHDTTMTKKQSDTLIQRMTQTLDYYGFNDHHIAGKIYGGHFFIEVMKSELMLFMSISFVLLVVFLYFSFRSFWGIWVPLTIVGLTLIWILGLMGFLGKNINLMTTVLPTIIFVVCISNVVHIVEKYIDELRKGQPKWNALYTGFSEMAMATFFTSLTTAIGFVSLVTSDIVPIQEFGWLTAIGVYFSFFLCFTLLPAIFLILPVPKLKRTTTGKSPISERLHSMFLMVVKRRRGLFMVCLAALLLSFVGVNMIEFNNSFIEDFAAEDHVVEDYKYFEEEFSGFRPFEMAIWIKDSNTTLWDSTAIAELDKMERYLDTSFGAGFIASPLTFLKSANKAMHGGKNEFFTLPEDKKELKRVQRNVKRLPRVSSRAYITDDAMKGRINAKVVDLGGHENRIRVRKLRAHFDEHINTDIIGYEITGMPYLVDKMNSRLAENIVLSLFLAFIVIACIMGFLFRSFQMIIISILPNLLPLLIIGAFMGFAGIDIKISTSIIYTIAFGIAVDDTIHFMSKLKIELDKGKSMLYALKYTYMSTGKAILVTTLILCTGFSILIASQVTSTFYIGLLISITLAFAVIADLLFLPILIMLFYSKPKRTSIFGKKLKRY